jgi:cyclic pyranopterin phosphate synthase
MSSPKFSHLDAEGTARMVDVGDKPIQHRTAVATGFIQCAPATVQALKDRALPKGDVLTVARIAGIQAAKITAQLIPLCHGLPLDKVDLDFEVQDSGVAIRATSITSAKTGVEMEALTAVSVAALTIYDMCKAVDQSMVIGSIQVVEKTKQ